MGVAAGAEDLRAGHAVAAVGRRREVLLGRRPEEAGPASAGVELGVRREQRQPATDAGVDPAALVVEQGPAEGPLGPLAPGDAELRREVEALLRSSEDDSGPIRYAIADAAQMVVERTPRTVATSSLIGTTILHYRVLDRIGAGGEGIIYKAEDTRLSRFVALKFLKDAARDSESFERFQRESRAASALNHPGICTVYDIGTYRGEPFIAMEYLDGKTLKDHIATRRLSIKEILDISIEISSALAAAHNKALVHRDIKPANIFITGEGLRPCKTGSSRRRSNRNATRAGHGNRPVHESSAGSW